MPYHTPGVSLAASRGDPFVHKKIGGFVKRNIGAVGRTVLGIAATVVPGPVGIAARFARSKIGAQRGRPQARRALRVGAQPSVQMMAPRFVSAPSGRAGTARVDVETGEELPKARRMNPLNPRALSRATRRLSSFTRRVRSVEKQLRKIAPKARSRPRADLGRGHRHVR